VNPVGVGTANEPSQGRRALATSAKESLTGYMFIMPATLALLVFMIIPILAFVLLVFVHYDLLSPPRWTGLNNIKRLVTDQRMLVCYRNSAVIAAGAVALNNTLGLMLAMGVNRKMPAVLKYLLRTTLFFPVLTTTASFAMVWRFMLTQDRGVVNWLIGEIGIAAIPWLSNPQWAIRSVIIYDVWKACGYLMVIYLAGLQGIPESLYEAAKIDGANRWQLTRHVTLPLITPTAFFCLIISCIGAFQIFDNAYVLTAGGPGDATRTIAMYIYEVAFRRHEMGYASTVALSLLLVLLCLTFLQFWGGKRWVNYD